MIDRIILGDNQFFGINHMSEEKGRSLAIRFKDIKAIIRVIDTAYECGVRAFMFNTHDRVEKICNHFRENPGKYTDLRLYPSLPYAHKYANAVHEKGLVGALNAFVFSGRSVRQVANTVIRSGMSVINKDMIEVMKLLVDAEMRIFRDLNVPAIFLQNIVTDLLLGFGSREVFIAFADHVKKNYGAEPAFNTMNMGALVDFLLDSGIENPIVCSSINKTGFLMTPGREEYERTLARKPFRPMAMSIFASGAISPTEAIKYVCGLPNIKSIVFGASSKEHIAQTIEMICSHWNVEASVPQLAEVS